MINTQVAIVTVILVMLEVRHHLVRHVRQIYFCNKVNVWKSAKKVFMQKMDYVQVCN